MPDKTEMMTSGVPSAEQPEEIRSAIAPVSEPNQTPSEALAPTEQSRQKLTNIRSDQRVVTIERDAAVQTQADTQMKYLLELLASLRSKHVLTGKLEGVEMSESSGPRASLYYGDFKVLIPFSELMDDPASYRDMNPNDVMRYLIAKRLGAEIDFVVRGIDQEANLVVASRKDAMAIRRRQFFFGQDRDGNNLLYEGAVAEARVVSVIRHPAGGEQLLHQRGPSLPCRVHPHQHRAAGSAGQGLLYSLRHRREGAAPEWGPESGPAPPHWQGRCAQSWGFQRQRFCRCRWGPWR